MGLLSLQMKRQWSERPPSGLQASAAAFYLGSPGPWGSWEFAPRPLSYPPPLRQGLCLHRTAPGASPSPILRRVFPRSLPLLTHSPWLPSALPTKPDPFYPAFKAPPSLSLPVFLIRNSNPAKVLQNFRRYCFTAPLPPAFAGAILLSGLPFPLLGLTEVLVRGQGLAQRLFPGRGGGGLSQVLLPLAHSLPSLALPWGRAASRSLAGSAPPRPTPLRLQPDQDSRLLASPGLHSSPTPAHQPARGVIPDHISKTEAPKPPTSHAWTSAGAFALVFGCHLHPPTATRGCP